jgi:drug/metabolite transporter (DMT)-like permease
VLGEPMTAWRAIGGALIVAGVVTHALARRPVPVSGPDEVRSATAAARPEPAG